MVQGCWKGWSQPCLVPEVAPGSSGSRAHVAARGLLGLGPGAASGGLLLGPVLDCSRCSSMGGFEDGH
jgi:hypothetical protein